MILVAKLDVIIGHVYNAKFGLVQRWRRIFEKIMFTDEENPNL